ncbi:Tet(A)/Tet(B)/Tet(C) family tetracycline efflux MFS transporter [Citrobacter freundii]|nr:Tet(A)/Tet(B)/Tet(C) family tetracycline efflux MFS transporter [Citrobacter freundii]EKA2136631.1 Tet(A)/Tet(B)/Tet(C) family tetracycline efflux MFS transporter [Citrobacter freundii]
MNKSLSVILTTVFLDAVGIGLVMPVLPELLRSLAGENVGSIHYGALLATYALMQFIFAPMLGALSDQFGRRPVLIVSLACAVADYLLMAAAPSLLWLYIGRIIAGVTGANMAVATAYVTDITPASDRAKRFGLLGAVFGVGFIAGPVLGGLLGEWHLYAPFLGAAAMNGINLIMAIILLQESKHPGKTAELSTGQPMFTRLSNLITQPGMAPLLGVFLIVTLVSQVPATLWVLYGQGRYGWSLFIAGMSLAGYGVCHALAQAFAIAPMVKRLGERNTLLCGLACDALGLLLLSIAVEGWMPFALLPLFALGGVAVPALQSMMARCVSDERQGELQGGLSSINSLGAIAGPLLVTRLYDMTQLTAPGKVWALAAMLYVLVLPILFIRRKSGQPGVL